MPEFPPAKNLPLPYAIDLMSLAIPVPFFITLNGLFFTSIQPELALPPPPPPLPPPLPLLPLLTFPGPVQGASPSLSKVKVPVTLAILLVLN